MKKHLSLAGILLPLAAILLPQRLYSAAHKIIQFFNRLFAKIKNNAIGLVEPLTRQTKKYLQSALQGKNISDRENRLLAGACILYIGSLKGYLFSLHKNRHLHYVVGDLQNKISASLAGVNGLLTAGPVQEFVGQIKQSLKEMLGRYKNSIGFNKYLDRCNKGTGFFERLLFV